MYVGIDKFFLLMWKNWVLQIRHPVQTLFEILVPGLFCAILVGIRSLVKVYDVSAKFFSIFNPSRGGFYMDSTGKRQWEELVFSPPHPIVEKVISEIKANIPYKLKFTQLKSAAMTSYLDVASKAIGIAFDDDIVESDDLQKLPDNVHFTLRFPSETSTNNFGIDHWHTNQIFPLFNFGGAREPSFPYTATPEYYSLGFLRLQYIISKTIFNIKTGGQVLPAIMMQRFPYPEYVSDPFLLALQELIGTIILLAFVYSSISIIKVITAEKEKQLKEAMKIMGLPGWLHWLAWFTKSLTFMLLSIIIMTALFKISSWYPEDTSAILPKCSVTVLLVFLLLYCCATITFCFALSVFFTKANLASGIGGVVFFLLYVPYTILHANYSNQRLSTKLLASLASNSAMGYGFQIICMFESTQEGLKWSNLWETATPGDNLAMGHIFLMLIADCVIYMLIALYVEAIFPGSYGVPKKWHFIFTWVIPKKPTEDFVENLDLDATCFEKEPTNMNAGIKISHLRKVYANKKVAVKDLSLTMYEDQITVLLGHNGAGKTTTMSMLTSMLPPTSGTAIINNYDIEKDTEKVRSSLGLCPQHNVLFDELTVAEHLYFFSRLKGMRGKEIQKDIDMYVKLLQFEDKKNKKSATLSGGMKRKLSVAVAFCGASKVIMLDEPTAGMDPAARRALWEFVETQKKDRTIMLTTHFMDEADLLGDRIAIMAEGTLQCYGTSFFLKKRYGAGYHLIIDKNPSCDVQKITDIMKTHIPDVVVYSNVGSELTYLLNEKDSQHFQPMLKDIEVQSDELGIRSYGISLTTLEDVFMKVGADHKVQDVVEKSSDHFSQDSTTDSRINVLEEKLTGCSLLMNQFRAMFMKRFLVTIRQWPLLLTQLLIPIFMLVVSILAARNTNSTILPSLDITLKSYSRPETMLLAEDPTTNQYYKTSKKWLENSKFVVEEIDYTKGLINTILQKTINDPPTVRLRNILAAEFSDSSILCLFNNEPYHSPPLALNFVFNTVLKSYDEKLGISVSNYPQPFKLQSKFQMMQQGNMMGLQMGINLGFCMAFIAAFYTLFYIKERIIKSKHLQFVSGLNVLVFWCVSLIWDWGTYLLTVVVILITLVCFQEDGFKTAEDMEHMFVVLLYFGFALFPLIYALSFLFSSPSTGFIRVVLFATFFGTFAFIVVEILAVEGLKLEHVAKAMDWIFMFVPHYAMSSGIMKIDKEYQRYTSCVKFIDAYPACSSASSVCWALLCAKEPLCCDSNENYYTFEKNGIMKNVLISLAVGVIGFVFLMMLEYKIFSIVKYAIEGKMKNKVKHDLLEDIDDDVKAEEERVNYMNGTEALVVKNVSKYYGNFLAVNNICLTVGVNECFGLLGVNGAGKTTTFRMISGDTHISSGDVYVKGLNLKKQNMEVNKLIGYCPQFDGLLEDLTCRETLEMFALLRGYNSIFCKTLAIVLAQDFNFYQHIDKKVKELSGGNKRKLSTAVALVGDPPILYLDEPTTGMDPAAKRFLWNALCQVRDSGKSLVLTSHSMEECEALCTRLAIMVDGRFKCLGSTQHLKNKFSQGYSLIVKTARSSGTVDPRRRKTVTSSSVVDYIRNAFPSAVLREVHQELITFYIADKSQAWSEMFGVMERCKEELGIEDYSLGQSSLEQVFLSFATKQRES